MARSKSKVRAAPIAFMFFGGMLAGLGAAHLGFSMSDRLRAIDIAGLLMAALLAIGGLFMLVIGSNARTYARLSADAEPGEAPDAGMIRFARQQGITNLLAGIAFAVPPLAVALGAPESLRMPLFIGIVALVMVESWVNLNLWRQGDELVRSVITRSGALCFWLLQGLFFFWAAAERMGLVPPADSWTLLVLLMGTYILVGSIVATRSGLAQR